MANARDIKRRIKSIQNTQKITQAMKMVAAAKVKKAENKVKSARPFTSNLNTVMQRVIAKKPELSEKNIKVNHAIENYPLLLDQREVKTVGLLVITSDKGLAGGYNANVVKRAIKKINELNEQNIAVKLFVVGQKGLSALNAQIKGKNTQVINQYLKLPAVPTVGSANVIAEDMAESFVDKEIDKIEIITTKFKSMISFDVEVLQILPIVIKSEEIADSHSQMVFEPSSEAVLQKMMPLYLSNRVYESLVEAAASELGSRMSAMGSATKNASEMIQTLTLQFNKARQASITQELLEVVSGAEALKS